jgi:hypothetical protein
MPNQYKNGPPNQPALVPQRAGQDMCELVLRLLVLVEVTTHDRQIQRAGHVRAHGILKLCLAKAEEIVPVYS